MANCKPSLRSVMDIRVFDQVKLQQSFEAEQYDVLHEHKAYLQISNTGGAPNQTGKGDVNNTVKFYLSLLS